MFKFHRLCGLWLFLSALILLNACSKTTFTPLPADGVILAFGDSLTVGYGTNPENSYPTVLARLSGRKVINAGISGETTQEGLARFSEVLQQTKPNLVILMEGGNDILRDINPAQTQQNLQSMITEAQARHIQVLLVGIPAKSLFSSSADFYQTLAEQNHIILDDKSVAKLIKTPEYKSDYVHLNQAGYQALAERFYQLLHKKSAL